MRGLQTSLQHLPLLDDSNTPGENHPLTRCVCSIPQTAPTAREFGRGTRIWTLSPSSDGLFAATDPLRGKFIRGSLDESFDGHLITRSPFTPSP